MPIRYGLTAGEFALMVNAEQRFGCDLTVVEVSGWNRRQLLCDTGLPWIPPSPALQHFENAVLYPGTCLLEGANVSEGRGTADPFALIGAPYIDGENLAEAMNGMALPGVRFLPAAFTPTECKYQGVPCSGVKIILDDPHMCQPVHGWAFAPEHHWGTVSAGFSFSAAKRGISTACHRPAERKRTASGRADRPRLAFGSRCVLRCICPAKPSLSFV